MSRRAAIRASFVALTAVILPARSEVKASLELLKLRCTDQRLPVPRVRRQTRWKLTEDAAIAGIKERR